MVIRYEFLRTIALMAGAISLLRLFTLHSSLFTLHSPQSRRMSSSKEEGEFYWTPLAIVQSIAIFCLAGIAEIFGGYLVWAAVKGLREESSTAGVDESVDRASEKSYNIVKKPWWYALIGSFVLV